MRKTLLTLAVGGAAIMAVAPSSAFAQTWQPGAEIWGQPVRVSWANGVTNTLYFDQNGTVRIAGPDGTEVTQGTWTASNQSICVTLASGARECWPYRMAFQAQQPVTLTSDCGSTSQWTALGTNQPPTQRRAGERG
jgi:hypothetical protein